MAYSKLSSMCPCHYEFPHATLTFTQPSRFLLNMFTFKSLRLDFGPETAQLAKRFVNVTRSISTYKSHLDFTRSCRDMNLVPRSLRLKRLVHTEEGHKIVAQAEKRLVSARIHDCQATLRRKELDLFFARRQLEHRIPDVFPALQAFATSIASTALDKRQTSQKEKISRLKKSDDSSLSF